MPTKTQTPPPNQAASNTFPLRHSQPISTPAHQPVPLRPTSTRRLPDLLTVNEVAETLRTTSKAVYAQIARGHLPGVIRLRRRVLIDRGELVSWLHRRRALSLERHQR
ncbi:MAG: helix-turn-helix domain-containing protein [Deltaproteobacteria bacterium]|nr:helix-turn-helix domain-containing protein [Deltaproteobacteria bacterium]